MKILISQLGWVPGKLVWIDQITDVYGVVYFSLSQTLVTEIFLWLLWLPNKFALKSQLFHFSYTNIQVFCCGLFYIFLFAYSQTFWHYKNAQNLLQLNKNCLQCIINIPKVWTVLVFLFMLLVGIGKSYSWVLENKSKVLKVWLLVWGNIKKVICKLINENIKM